MTDYIADIIKSIFILISGILILSALGTEIAKQMSVQFIFMGAILLFIGLAYLFLKVLREFIDW
ncbi:hypothetical protein [Flavobacterium sp.]|uniref:hypothetical protein n=1 Tax=Flavobacterium sp. TaxID=239 RepID=UPI00261DBE89|nr:hypothetical protein [Flavobacterium sp.]